MAKGFGENKNKSSQEKTVIKVVIIESPNTQNFLICLNSLEFVYDSALTYKAAELVATALRKALKKHPIKKLTQQTLWDWIKAFGHLTPDVDAWLIQTHPNSPKKFSDLVPLKN